MQRTCTVHEWATEAEKRNAIKESVPEDSRWAFRALHIKPLYFQVKFTIVCSERTREATTGTGGRSLTCLQKLLEAQFSVGDLLLLRLKRHQIWNDACQEVKIKTNIYQGKDWQMNSVSFHSCAQKTNLFGSNTQLQNIKDNLYGCRQMFSRWCWGNMWSFVNFPWFILDAKPTWCKLV